MVMALYSSYTDEQLLASLRSGDTVAFTEVYERYWDKLLIYVTRFIRRPSDAEDIVQELWVSIWRRREELHIERNLSTYLYTSARYLAIRHIQTSTTYAAYLDRLAAQLSVFATRDESLEPELFGRELDRQIDKLIEELPEKMKEVFILSRKHHLSYKEIAERLSISEETVRKQIYKSLQILRNRLGPAGLFIWLSGHFFL